MAEVTGTLQVDENSGVAHHARILDSFIQDLGSVGVVGEERAAKLIYLGLTSRVLDRPVNIAVKGPSSAGKSHLVDSVLRFFPPKAYIALSAMSEKAILYDEESFQHRVLVLFENAGLNGPTALYLVRSLLSEGRLTYKVTERSSHGKFRTRSIAKQGPTALLTTTTRAVIHEENETRLLSVTIDDSPQQTKRILMTSAQPPGSPPDLKPWTKLQEWLQSAQSRVVIPYAERLAGLIPPIAVRLRRDFPTVLNLIRAHAVLHQLTRERTADGEIIASLEDYAVVRELVGDLVAQGVGSSVSPAIRETVAAVREAGGRALSVSELARLLQLDKSAASRRVKVAIRCGYLENQETRRGKPALLGLADLLPEEVTVLPPPEVLQ